MNAPVPVTIRPKQFRELTGIPDSTRADWGNPKSPRFDPTFPKKAKLGSRTVGYYYSVSVQRTHLPLKMNFAHDTVFTGAYHDHHTYPRHMATTPSRMAAKPTQQKRLLPKTQPQTYHVLQMGKQTLRQNNTHLT